MRHLTRNEIIEQCKRVARQNRTGSRAMWTAMCIMCGYALLKSEGFKGQRISNVTKKVNEMYEEYEKGNLDIDILNNRLLDKAEFSFKHEDYTESEITEKKGTYAHWIIERQIAPQNEINKQSIEYMIMFFNALIDLYGFGKERLNRVFEQIEKERSLYDSGKASIEEWRKELMEDAGIVFEEPIDPLTQKNDDGRM